MTLKMSPDYMISKIRSLLRTVNSERNQRPFLFLKKKKPHDETADKNTNDSFTLKEKISRKSSFCLHEVTVCWELLVTFAVLGICDMV